MVQYKYVMELDLIVMLIRLTIVILQNNRELFNNNTIRYIGSFQVTFLINNSIRKLKFLRGRLYYFNVLLSQNIVSTYNKKTYKQFIEYWNNKST